MDSTTKSNLRTTTYLKNSLALYKAVQAYNTVAMMTGDFQALLDLTLDTFMGLFEVPNCMILEYFERDNSLYPIAYQNFEHLSAIPPIPFDINRLENRRKSFTTYTNNQLSETFVSLGLSAIIACPMYKNNGIFYGFVICGNPNTNNETIPKEIFQLEGFTALTHQAGFYINNYRANEQLRLEIEERKLAEEKIAEQTMELKRSNEDLQQFAYVISHDLKAPLRNITSFAQLLEHSFEEELSEEAKEYLHFILTGVKQLGSLIDDLLTYSRASKKPIDFEPVEFDLIVESVQYNVNIAIQESNATIHYDNLPIINASFNQMTLLFQNLISNAIKFRQAGVEPVIHIESTIYDDKHTLLTVKDNGIGIESEYFERVFSLFQRLHRQDEYEGTGLGLSICKKIMERHNGNIWIESEGLNKGTTFFIVLPNYL